MTTARSHVGNGAQNVQRTGECSSRAEGVAGSTVGPSSVEGSLPGFLFQADEHFALSDAIDVCDEERWRPSWNSGSGADMSACAIQLTPIFCRAADSDECGLWSPPTAVSRHASDSVALPALDDRGAGVLRLAEEDTHTSSEALALPPKGQRWMPTNADVATGAADSPVDGRGVVVVPTGRNHEDASEQGMQEINLSHAGVSFKTALARPPMDEHLRNEPMGSPPSEPRSILSRGTVVSEKTPPAAVSPLVQLLREASVRGRQKSAHGQASVSRALSWISSRSYDLQRKLESTQHWHVWYYCITHFLSAEHALIFEADCRWERTMCFLSAINIMVIFALQQPLCEVFDDPDGCAGSPAEVSFFNNTNQFLLFPRRDFCNIGVRPLISDATCRYHIASHRV